MYTDALALALVLCTLPRIPQDNAAHSYHTITSAMITCTPLETNVTLRTHHSDVLWCAQFIVDVAWFKEEIVLGLSQPFAIPAGTFTTTVTVCQFLSDLH